MYRVTNSINSPFELDTLNGRVILPAGGTLEVELAQPMVDLLLAANIVKLEKVEAKSPSADDKPAPKKAGRKKSGK